MSWLLACDTQILLQCTRHRRKYRLSCLLRVHRLSSDWANITRHNTTVMGCIFCYANRLNISTLLRPFRVNRLQTVYRTISFDHIQFFQMLFPYYFLFTLLSLFTKILPLFFFSLFISSSQGNQDVLDHLHQIFRICKHMIQMNDWAFFQSFKGR